MESRERTRVGMAGGASESGLCDRKHFRRIVRFFEGPIWVRGGTFALVARESSNAKRKARHQNSQTSKQQGSKVDVGNLLLAVWSNKDSNSLNHVVKLPRRQDVNDRR